MDFFRWCRKNQIGQDVIRVLVNQEQKELEEFQFRGKKVFQLVHTQKVPKKYAPFLDSFFPGPQHKQIQYDEDYSLSYVTPYRMADEITKWILSFYNAKSAIDFTSGLGGNVLSFARNKSIERVIGVEYNETRFLSLKHNVELYPEQKKITLYQGNCIDFIDMEFPPHSFVYMDPPWGGVSYQDEVIDELFFYKDDIPYGVNELVMKLLKKVDCVVLKVPYNYSEKSLTGMKYQKRVDKKVKHILILKQGNDKIKLPKMAPKKSKPDVAYGFKPEVEIPYFDGEYHLPEFNLLVAGQIKKVPIMAEEDETSRNIRFHFIMVVGDATQDVDEAIQYSYYHLNDILYGTRYSEKIENRLNFLRNFL